MTKVKMLTKRNLQTINIFQYHVMDLFPTLRPELTSNPYKPTHFKINFRNIVYNYIVDFVRGFDKTDFKEVYSILKDMYLSDSQQKIAQNKAIKLQALRLNYTTFSSLIQDCIQILISNPIGLKDSTKNLEQRISRTQHGKPSASNPFGSETRKEGKEELLFQNYQQSLSFYVVHSNRTDQADSLTWLHFVEKYEFTNIKSEEQRPNTPVIIYQAAYSYSNGGLKIGLDFNGLFLQNYFEKTCPVISNKSILLNCLAQSIKKVLRRKMQSVQRQISNASFESSRRRYLKLKNQYRPIFEQLKQKSVAYRKKTCPDIKYNGYFIENIVCRMMQNNNYSLQQSWRGLIYYFDCQKNLRHKYNWESFQQFHKMNIFNYIGKDFMGRPVLLNRMRNCLMSKIQDKKLFFDYHLYLFQIFLQDKMEGWVDQFNVIVDGEDQINDNTDLLFSQDLLSQLFKIILGKTHHLIGCNIGLIGKILLKIFFTLLPERVVKQVEMFSTKHRQQAVQKLREIMPIQTIPHFLGGENQKTLFQDKNKEDLEDQSSEVSIQLSLLTNQKRKLFLNYL